MLSNLVISSQRFVVIIDEFGGEKIAERFVCQLLREQGQDESTIKKLPLNTALKETSTFANFLNDCLQPEDQQQQEQKDTKWNVLLPPFSVLLTFQNAAIVFEFLNNLRQTEQVKRLFLWISPRHLLHPHAAYLVAACEHMADLVVRLETTNQLSIVTRKPGGGVTNKHYTYNKSKTEFLVEPVKSTRKSQEAPTPPKSEQIGTFKIELDEEELVARNALKLPYEKTFDDSAGAIIYTPDAADDFDDEDPDEDLCI